MEKQVAVVVTYNRLEMLKNCIKALQEQTLSCDIMIINNASTDGTEQYMRLLQKEHKNIRYYNTGKNIGGAGGFSYGMRKAVENGYEYVWIMDDDCFAKKDALEKLIEADRILGGSSSYGYLSSLVLWTDGTECKMNRQKKAKKAVKNNKAEKYGLIQVEQSTFVSLLFSTTTIKKIGLPIKEFFIWGDDVEYTRRISIRNRIPCYMVKESKVVHAMKENNGSSIATDNSERIARYNYAYRNENYLYRKEGLKGICYYFAKCCLNLGRIIIKAKDNRAKRCAVILKAMFCGLFFNPEIEYL